MKTKFCIWDLVPAAVIAVLACALLLSFSEKAANELTAVVLVGGSEVDRVVLHTEQVRTYTAKGCTLTVTFCPDGKKGVQVTASDCPNGDCVRTGLITRAGQSIICLPTEFVVELVGDEQGGVDAVIG